MEALIEHLVATTGIDRSQAEQVIGIILDFLMKEGPADKVQGLMTQMPGTEKLVAAARAEEGGGGSMGGIMGAANRLMNAGLSMNQVQGVTREFVAFARERAGEDAVGDVVGAIPGLGAFV